MFQLHNVIGSPDSSGRGNLITGEIISVDQTNHSCQVKPHKDNIPQLENVPLRVFNLEDDLGVIIIPEIGSVCLVEFLEGSTELPIIRKVQTWQKIIIKKQDTIETTIDPEGNIDCITEGNAHIKVKENVEIENQAGMHIILDGTNKEIKLNQGDHQIIMKQDGTHIGSESAKQPLMLGNATLRWLTEHKHITTTPGQPTSTPIPPPTKDILSDDHFTEK